MNEWSERSAELAQTQDYLDKLQAIYPADLTPRKIESNDITHIRNLFLKRDRAGLLQYLLTLEKFPYEEPYKAYLEKDPASVKRNPNVVRRIADQLFDMGVDSVVAGISMPKAA